MNVIAQAQFKTGVRHYDMSEPERKIRIEAAAAFRLAHHYRWNLQINNHICVRIPGKPDLPIVASLLTLDAQGNVEARTEGSIRGEGSKGKDAVSIAKPAAAAAGVGALVDGSKGAAIGSGIGAAVGLATVFATRGKDLELPRGSALDIVLDRPLAVPVDSEESGPRNH